MKNIAIQNYSLLEFSIVGLENGGKFPIEYTGRGKDISPEIIIHNLSPKAKTIAITLEDTTHIIKDFTHWCIWNIAADNRIEKGIPKGKNCAVVRIRHTRICLRFALLCGTKTAQRKNAYLSFYCLFA